MTIQERIANHVCCFCEGELGQTGGNNPDPACTMKDARCCDYCDEAIVMHARFNISKLIEIAVAEKNAPPFDLDEDTEDEDSCVTVGLMNTFRDKFSQSDADSRDLMLQGLFQVDQQGRANEFDNVDLRKKSVMDLYGSLNEIRQEQIRRYIVLLLADQENMIE